MKPFYEQVDSLYHLATDKLPDSIRERSIALAFGLGFGGSYSLVNALQWTSENVADKIIPSFDDKALPPLETACMIGITAVPIIYSLIKPEEIKKTIQNHPVYTSGMTGVWLGSMIGALQDFI